MIDGCEIKRTLVDNGLAVNVCSHKFLIQFQKKGVEIPPLEETTFRIRAYDSSSKNPIGITKILVTTRVKIVAT